jgi:DNA-binding transcriptional MerR regulator
MRIAELSRQTGVSVPTIKYYQREGLLPPGELIRRNQATYDERHVRRLLLIRAMVDIGRVPIASIRDVLAALAGPAPDLHRALGTALTPSAGGRADDDADLTEALGEVDALVERRGWWVHEGAPARRTLAEVIATVRRLGADDLVGRLDEYAELSERTAELDLAVVQRRTEPEMVVYAAVVGAILGDSLFGSLRRLAQEHTSAKAFGITDPDEC